MAIRKKVINCLGTQKETANLLGISLSYWKTLIYCKNAVPIPLAKKIVELSDGKIKLEDLRPDLKCVVDGKAETVEDKLQNKKNADKIEI